jgi:hypothetical protein
MIVATNADGYCIKPPQLQVCKTVGMTRFDPLQHLARHERAGRTASVIERHALRVIQGLHMLCEIIAPYGASP